MAERGGESSAHAAAKEAIVEAVRAWKEGGATPVFVRRCAAGGCAQTIRQPMPSKVVRAVAEKRLHSGRVVDVALLGRADLIVAAIEVFQTHAVDDEKWLDLGIPWLEVEAAQVIESEGRVLLPRRDRLRVWTCEAHGSERTRTSTRSRDDRLRRAAAIRALPFRRSEFPAYRIARVVRCPAGHDAIVWKWTGTAPPWPRPPLVVAREKKADVWFDRTNDEARAILPWRRHFASVCATCGAELTPEG